MIQSLIALAGIALLLAAGFALSTNRRLIRPRVVAAAFALQAAIAVVVLYWDPGQRALQWLSERVLVVIGYSREGIELVFGGLASDTIGFSFFVGALPIVIFFSALMSILYHWGIMQRVVWLIGGAIRKTTGVGAAESMNAAANIFVGQTEAPLAIRPYLPKLNEAQLFTVMVSGLSSVAATMIAAYTFLGAALEHIIAASFMAAPGSLLMAKLMFPDEPGEDQQQTDLPRTEHDNVIMAAATGASDGVRLAINIAAMLIAFVSVIALFNGVIGYFGGWFGIDDLSLQKIFGWIFAPVMFMLSIPWAEAQAAGALFGEKLVLNEFIAFSHLNDYLAAASERTRAIVTFALCGFANFGSIAILLGGLGTLVPEQREVIGRLGIRAVAAASLANLVSAAIVGLVI